MSDIMVYLAIFSTIIVCTHKMKIGLWYPLELGTFLISEDPPPNFEFFPTETWDCFDFFTPSPLFGLFHKFPRFFVWKASLTLFVRLVMIPFIFVRIIAFSTFMCFMSPFYLLTYQVGVFSSSDGAQEVLNSVSPSFHTLIYIL